MRNTNLPLVVLLLGLSTAAFAAPSAGSGTVSLTLSAQIEQEYLDAKGKPAKRLVPVKDETKVLPGDEVVYTISFHNRGAQPATDVVVTDPIPANAAYRDGSAFGAGTEIAFSADGGKTYAKPEVLKVKGADGKERAASAADYTHVRWKLLAAVAPGQNGFVRFRAVVK